MNNGIMIMITITIITKMPRNLLDEFLERRAEAKAKAIDDVVNRYGPFRNEEEMQRAIALWTNVKSKEQKPKT